MSAHDDVIAAIASPPGMGAVSLMAVIVMGSHNHGRCRPGAQPMEMRPKGRRPGRIARGQGKRTGQHTLPFTAIEIKDQLACCGR